MFWKGNNKANSSISDRSQIHLNVALSLMRVRISLWIHLCPTP